MPDQDPNGLKPNEPGAKLDAGKPNAFRGLLDYFPRALLAVSEVSSYGARKYSWGGWKHVPDGLLRYSDAQVRHLLIEASGEPVDKETGLLHAAHTAWNALARLELLLKEVE